MPTIKDVARMAGVGLGTASRVVRGQGSVSPDKLERVQKAVEALGYRPSHTARSLLSGTSRMVGVYIPDLTGTFYTPILRVIDTELRAAGLHMVVAFGVGRGGARQQAIEGIEFLIERGCDGVIAMTNALLEEDLARFGVARERLVALNHYFDSIPGQCFTADHRLGGQLAARALLAHDHREIAVVAGPASVPDNASRIDGFMAELALAGIDTSALWQHEGDFSSDAGWNAARALLASNRPFTALFCANDEMAMGAMAYFQEAGLRVPHDVAVIGYDDTPGGKFSAPRLTSVHIPWDEMTRNGLSELLNRCYGLDRPVERNFAVSVTMRSSLSRPPLQRRKTRDKLAFATGRAASVQE
ncbi:LacI family DNA-binding transcriptional regulator [Massilia yuzhufengensis]|uniref:Transcriptional regulator, LacI family n=1 Tax=Massilia yuzhufengensis TaxID=1164594 RepID=A0A1I1ET64_9BURK|nr:LacI family DNA-binding transcriptional regulator [Massilia yuzhufengensis]SFB88718.1 transcriptional regulator, LacI family [Massilia yuzhufengensis]